MQRPSHLIGAVALAALLSACGGGGGSSGSGDGGFNPAPGVSFDAFAAWRNLLTTSRSWTVSGIGSDGLTYAVAIATTPGAATLFPITGTASSRSDALVTTTAGGTSTTVLQETFFDAATLEITGLRTTIGGLPTCDVPRAGGVAAPPSGATIPNSGLLATLDELDGCLTTSAPLGTIDLTWSLFSEGGINYFCLNSTERTTAGSVSAIESDCVQVEPDGSLGTAARVSLERGGFTLVAR